VSFIFAWLRKEYRSGKKDLAEKEKQKKLEKKEKRRSDRRIRKQKRRKFCILIVVIDIAYDPSRWLNLIRWLSGLKDESIAMSTKEVVICKILQY